MPTLSFLVHYYLLNYCSTPASHATSYYSHNNLVHSQPSVKMFSFHTKNQFAAIVGGQLASEREAEAESATASAATNTEKVIVPPRISRRGKILTISTATEVEVKHPKAKQISLEPILSAWQEDEEALEDLNAELRAESHAEEKEGADVYDEVDVKNLRPGRVNAHFPVICSTSKLPETQTAKIVNEQSRCQTLQKLCQDFAEHELFTSGSEKPPPLLPTCLLSGPYNPTLLNEPATSPTSQERLEMQKQYPKFRGMTDQLVTLHKINEAEGEAERKVAARKWAETSDELQKQAEKQAEKHAKNKRTTWFETTMQDLHALSGLSPHQDTIVKEAD